SLGATEITKMIEEDHEAEAVCSFCGNKYHYTKEDLEELKKEALEESGK
ncbi:MAG TPA: Hsp33 family molecular chaperone HslO, partial [Tetragenococcus sp.]|nr:Hsp33 family molecular chaperone HslO [Tetragenococcus sp.]